MQNKWQAQRKSSGSQTEAETVHATQCKKKVGQERENKRGVAREGVAEAKANIMLTIWQAACWSHFVLQHDISGRFCLPHPLTAFHLTWHWFLSLSLGYPCQYFSHGTMTLDAGSGGASGWTHWQRFPLRFNKLIFFLGQVETAFRCGCCLEWTRKRKNALQCLYI